MTDGYQVYHILEKEFPDTLNVVGCWTNCKRKFAEIIKSIGTKIKNGTIAAEANERIAAIYHVDNMTKGKSDKENFNQSIDDNGELYIGEDTLIGTNVSIIGCKYIGRHCIIAANCVVTHDLPDYCVAAGNPCRVIKRYNFESPKWEKV